LESLESRQLLAVVSLNPTKDNTMFQANNNVSAGKSDSVLVGLDHYSSTLMRSLLAFDVAGSIPAGSTINSVSLTLWCNDGYNTGSTPSVELHKVLADWGEGASSPGWMPPYTSAKTGDATWRYSFYNTQSWSTLGGDFSPTVSSAQTVSTGAKSYTWGSTAQMTADVQSWLNTPSANFGWVLKGDETQESGKMFDSRESTNAARRPTLTVDYTPPAAPSLAIAATDAAKAEGNSGSAPFTFTVTRTGTTTGTSSVNYAVTGSGASAANAADFAGGALPNGTVSFAANETSKVITINVNGDSSVESNEGFTVTLSSPAGATITTATATGTINNDDSAPVPSLAIAATDAAKAEGNSGSTAFTFTVTRNGDATGTSSVNYAVTGSGASAANAADFAGGALPNGTVSFAANEISKVITINVNGDSTVESNEGFTVTLSSPAGATITTATATGTINNDDSTPAPSLAIAATDAAKAEGNSGSTAFTFTVTRNGNTTGTSSVNYAVTGSGANPADATDFAGGVLPSGTVSFAANETSKVITVNVNGDSTVESDEGFTVTLSSPAGATIATATATGAINNDDTGEVPSLVIAATDAAKAEGNSGSTAFTFTVTRSGDTTGTSSVNYAVTGSGGSAANATDFTGGVLPGGTVSFAASETTKVITVNVNGDTSVESDEGFTVTLSSPAGATIATAAATGSINNDDTVPPPSLAIAATAAVKAEGNSGSTAFTFTVTRSGDTTGTSSVNYAVTGSGSSAADSSDFAGGSLPGGTVSFAASETTKVITVNVNGDTTVESDEGFTVTLSSPAGATIVTATATGSINNDDTDSTIQPGVSLVNGVLTITGSVDSDQVSVELRGRSQLWVAASFLNSSADDDDDDDDDDDNSQNSGLAFSLKSVKRIEMNLYDGNDVAVVSSSLRIPATISGGSGDDVLKGGNGDDILLGEDGNDKLSGNGGRNILVGGDGDDELDAGSDRSLLIGGSGQDRLKGSNREDILIGGTTAYDTDQSALVSIMAEWTSRRPFATRMKNLTSGVGTGKSIKLRLGETVLDDGARDTLFGGASSDWFLSFPTDSAADRGRSDR
jgi:hypothetical protein